MMATAAVEIAGVSVKRGKHLALSSIDLQLAKGKITGLLGPSGAGKTSLMRAVVGIQQGVRGKITVLGQPAGSRKLKHQLAYGTQDSSVFRDLTVLENVRYAAKILGVEPGKADAVIQRVGLAEQAKQLVESLSGGQRSRVSLAVALVGDPELIILDEPTVGLDPVLRQELWALFRSIAAEGRTLVISSHVMDEAEKCDDVVLLRMGQVLYYGPLAQLLEQTGAMDAEEAFIRSIGGAN